MAVNLLFALIGPLMEQDTFWPSFPLGNYEVFDREEAESLGDGLIDLSARDTISALCQMNIFARFRFLLQSKTVS